MPMFSSSNALKNDAREKVQEGKEIIRALGKEVLKTARKASKNSKYLNAKAINSHVNELKSAYPKVSNDLRHLAQDKITHIRDFLQSTGNTACAKTRAVKVCAIKLGIVCLAVKLFGNEDAKQAARKVKAHIEAKPVQSAAIALGVGYFLAKALR